jgi:flagellar basal-body rod modification protein FlgD
MEIPGITANDSPHSPGGLPAADALGKDAFMKLLVSQIRNQDPLAPTDNQAFIAQLAEFSGLEQMQELNDNIIGLALLQQGNALMDQLTNSGALIGQSVSYIDPATQEEQTGTVSSVKIEDGLAVLMIDGKDVPLANVTEITGEPVVEPGDSPDSGDTGDTGDGGDDETTAGDGA